MLSKSSYIRNTFDIWNSLDIAINGRVRTMANFNLISVVCVIIMSACV